VLLAGPNSPLDCIYTDAVQGQRERCISATVSGAGKGSEARFCKAEPSSRGGSLLNASSNHVGAPFRRHWRPAGYAERAGWNDMLTTRMGSPMQADHQGGEGVRDHQDRGRDQLEPGSSLGVPQGRNSINVLDDHAT
jgi:hypothetical protein